MPRQTRARRPRHVWLTFFTALAIGPWAWAQNAPIGNERPQPVAQPVRPVARPPIPPLAKPVPATRPAAANPAAELSPQDLELVRMVQIEVAQQVRQIRTGTARQRERAHQSLFQLHRQLLLPLDAARRQQSLSPREFNRALIEWTREIRLAQLGEEFGTEPMDRLRRLRTAQPEIFERLLSDDPLAQATGFNLLLKWKDPDQLAEPLVLRTLRGMEPGNVHRVADLLLQNRYHSTAALDGLLAAYDGRSMPQPAIPLAAMVLPGIRQKIIQVLDRFEDPRLPPILLQGLLDNRTMYQAAPLTNGLIKNNGLGAIPVLMDNLRDDEPSQPFGLINNTAVTYSKNDTLIYAVLKLTGQSLDEYGLQTPAQGDRSNRIGFATDAARKAAVEKLRTWGSEHRDTPPYDTAAPVAPQPLPPVAVPPGGSEIGGGILVR